MQPILINAKTLKEKKIFELKQEVGLLEKQIGRKPKLVIVSASDDKASKNYIKGKVRIGAEIGIDVEVLEEESTVTTQDILSAIHDLNFDSEVDAIILQLPVYKHLDSEVLINSISPCKDADCFAPINLGKMFAGDYSGVLPCTPNGVLNLLNHHDVDVIGRDVVVIGRSTHVGKSLSALLTHKGATVTTCHSKTSNLNMKISQADVVISCTGQRGLIDPRFMKKGSVLIGVGIIVDENYKQQTDYDIEPMLIFSECAIIGDRVNTTGTATILALMENVVMLSKV